MYSTVVQSKYIIEFPSLFIKFKAVVINSGSYEHLCVIVVGHGNELNENYLHILLPSGLWIIFQVFSKTNNQKKQKHTFPTQNQKPDIQG